MLIEIHHHKTCISRLVLVHITRHKFKIKMPVQNKRILMWKISQFTDDNALNTNTVEPRYKEVGYNKTLL